MTGDANLMEFGLLWWTVPVIIAPFDRSLGLSRSIRIPLVKRSIPLAPTRGQHDTVRVLEGELGYTTSKKMHSGLIFILIRYKMQMQMAQCSNSKWRSDAKPRNTKVFLRVNHPMCPCIWHTKAHHDPIMTLLLRSQWLHTYNFVTRDCKDCRQLQKVYNPKTPMT